LLQAAEAEKASASAAPALTGGLTERLLEREMKGLRSAGVAAA
jgi:5-aminolevulinate synthase